MSTASDTDVETEEAEVVALVDAEQVERFLLDYSDCPEEIANDVTLGATGAERRMAYAVLAAIGGSSQSPTELPPEPEPEEETEQVAGGEDAAAEQEARVAAEAAETKAAAKKK